MVIRSLIGRPERNAAAGVRLPRAVRHRLERALGADLLAVRVHSGPAADATAVRRRMRTQAA